MSVKAEPFCLGGVRVEPGQRKLIELAIPALYAHTNLGIPAQVVHGRRSGPRLFVCAAIHGDEINGVEIIRRLVNIRALERLHGTVIAVPVVNIYGFINQSRYLPDRRDLNRSFPGSDKGSLAARLAHVFLQQIAAVCTHGIDLHTGAIHRENLAQIRANLSDPETARMARAFPARVTINTSLLEGSLRKALAELGIPVIVYEAGEALRFDEIAIRTGVNGVVSVMRELAMLPQRRGSDLKLEPLVARASGWIRAPQSGILHSTTGLGANVETDQLLAIVSDPFGEREEAVRAPAAGVIVGRTNLPLVNEGEALYHLARFESPGAATDTIEAFQFEVDPATDQRVPEEPPIV
ncbi:MAG: succinylglutamate desuccinylase/aspartoacylase family protein [Gammaproteobacteria bacterium]